MATSVAAAAGENVKGREREAAAAPVGRSLQWKGEDRFLFFFCDKEATYTATIKEV